MHTSYLKSLICLTLVLMVCISACHQTVTSDKRLGVALGVVDAQLREASGLVASINNPGYLWTLNDSGNTAEIFLIDEQAKTRMTCAIVNATNRDWEDISIGVGPDPKKNYLYIADIGDNGANHKYKFIYRVEEPVLGKTSKISLSVVDTLILRLPDGKRDSETLLVDPSAHDFYIVSKREKNVSLYKGSYPFQRDTITLEKALNIPFTEIVGGSISADGQEVLLKNYDEIYYWRKSGEESLSELLSKDPVKWPYHREPQGEAIAWSRDGSRFYTLSEGAKKSPASLMVYQKQRE